LIVRLGADADRGSGEKSAGQPIGSRILAVTGVGADRRPRAGDGHRNTPRLVHRVEFGVVQIRIGGGRVARGNHHRGAAFRIGRVADRRAEAQRDLAFLVVFGKEKIRIVDRVHTHSITEAALEAGPGRGFQSPAEGQRAIDSEWIEAGGAGREILGAQPATCLNQDQRRMGGGMFSEVSGAR